MLLPSPVSAGERASVTFLNPGAPDDPFFGMMTGFMQAAAKDLGMDLDVIYCDRDHLKMHDKGMALLERKELPDYLILINEKNAGVDVLRAASRRGVKVALINEGLQPNDAKRLGAPGEVLENWVLQFLPNDQQAGEILARALVQEARTQGKVDGFGRVNMVGIAGTFQTGSSSSRVDGLRNATQEADVIVHQVVPAYWEEDHAREVADGFLKRYPEVSVVWAASDLMARGVRTAFRENARAVVVGGIDWAEFALHMVERGELDVTVGGHFMDGAWTLIMLYDLDHGLALNKKEYLSEFSLISKNNVREYLKYFGKHDWDVVDFKQFSRHENPRLKQYDFGLEPVMRQLQQ